MATEACGLVLGRGRCHHEPRRPSGRSTCASTASFLRSPRFLPVSCKTRQRNLSSQNRRQQAKKVRPERAPLNMSFQSIGDENIEVQKTNTDSDSSTHPESVSCADAGTRAIIKIDRENFDGLSTLEERSIMIEKADGEEPRQIIRLEDLIGMIRNAEKNILLLNQARVRALEDLDRILIEKNDLQGEVNLLEMKLAETDSCIKVAAQEKVHVELHENQLEKMKIGMSSGEINEESRRGLYKKLDSPSLDHSINEELSVLKEENTSLKTDVQILKAKLSNIKETDERIVSLEKERSLLETSLRELESRLAVAQEDVSKLSTLEFECKALWEKVENLQSLLDNATKQADQAETVLQRNDELQRKNDKLEASLEEVNSHKILLEEAQRSSELLQQKVKLLEDSLQISDQEIYEHIQLYQSSVKEFQDALNSLKEESKRKSLEEAVDDMPLEFWSRLLLIIDGWFLENKISANDVKLFREMTWKRDARIRDAYLACKGKNEHEVVAAFLKLASSGTRPGLHVIHIAAEMAPVAKVGGLGDVVSGLSKALQRKGHLVEIIIPKYDCVQYDGVSDLRELDVVIQSYFDGQLFKNKVWVGTVEGLPVYFIEPHHPAKFFWRGQVYGEHDDFKRFSFFSRAALELLYQAGKKPDIIHCHDWQTAFVAPLYWDVYAPKGFNSARICFTCHNFEYQGTSPASELASCGLDVHQLNRPDRMQDNSSHDRVNPVKGAIVYSNIVTTVSPTYSQEVRTAEGGKGLHGTLNLHSRKFVGILNGIDTDSWNPATDTFLKFQYNADDLQGKAENKNALRKHLRLSSANALQPLVGCITRLVPQKGVHLIRHAIYRALELGGQFILLGSSPVPHIQREFEGIANHFQNHPHVRLVLKYDDTLSHSIYAASDMFVIPSIFEPCGLTQMIAMRYGSVPIVRKTGGLNDSVFDVDDDTIPVQLYNGFTFLTPDEQGLSGAMERAFNLYMRNPDSWKVLVEKNMKIDFSWDSSSTQYEELYVNSVARARAAANIV